MGVFSRIRLFFLNSKEKDKIILIQKDEISELKDKLITLNNVDRINTNIIFDLRRKNNKLSEENEKLKNERDLKKRINFEFFDIEIEEEILKQLSLVKKEVNIAVAWITSKYLIDKLEELSKNRIIVNIIVTKDTEKENKDYYIESLRRLKILANKLNILEIKSKDPRFTNYMHNKYCIIDDNKVIDGSYNWSKSAKYNEEHIIVVESEIVANLYKQNFIRLINKNGYENNIRKIS